MRYRFVKKLFIHLSLIGTLVLSQNCSDGFQVQNIESSLGDSVLDQNPPAVCTTGDTQTGYLMATSLAPQLCGQLITKTCVNGAWDRSEVLNATCAQLCRHPVTNEAAAVGTTHVTYSVQQAATQELCNNARVQSVCNQTTGTFLPAPAAHSACLVQGQTCAYANGAGLSVPTGNMTGATVMGYAMPSSTYPTLCGNQVTRTCQASGAWSGTTPLYTACEQRCLHPDTNQPSTQNSVYTYYTRQTGTTAECNAARTTSTCQASSGLFSPVVAQTRFASCTIVNPPPPSNGTLNPAVQLEFVNAAGARQLVNVIDGQTQITGVAPFLVQIDASGTRAPTAFAAQSQNTDAAAYAFLMVGYRLHFGENLGGVWRYPEGSSHSRDEETGPPIFSRVYKTPGAYNARLKVRDVLGNESTIRFTVNVTASPTAVNIPASAGSWPTLQSNRHYTLQAGGDYRSFGTIETGGLHNITFEKVGSGANPQVATFSPDGRSKFSATQMFEARAAHIRLINIDVRSINEGQRGYDYVGIIGGIVSQYSYGGQSSLWSEGTNILRSNVRYPRGLFLQDTEIRSTASGSGYVVFGTFHGLHARNTRFVHTENGATSWAMLRIYGSYFSLRNNLWHLSVDGGSSNGTLTSLLAVDGRVETRWRDDDTIGPIDSSNNNDRYGYISEKQIVQNNQLYSTGSFLTNGVASVGGGNPNGNQLVRPRLIGWEDNVFFPSGNVGRTLQNGEVYGQHVFWRNNRRSLGTGSFVSASSGAPNRVVGDNTTFNGPQLVENENTRPSPTGF